MLLIYLVTERIYHLIEVLRLPLFGCAERVAGRIVEHDNVVELHLAQSRCTVVAPLRPLYVRLAVEHRKRMLGERHGKRGVRLARTVAYLAHEEIVAREKRFLERA